VNKSTDPPLLLGPTQISFGVAPATLAYTLGLRHALDVVSLLLFTSGGLARLARFNATVALIPTKSDGSSKYFTGIPIPSSLLLTASMAGLVKAGKFVGAKGYNLGLNLGKLTDQGDLPFGSVTLFGDKGGWGEVHVLSLVFLAWAAMMVSKTLKVSKRALPLLIPG
jgi:CDP-diacylglycerol--serine O-phosphatidyltransferase